ncbi:hypothetical protein GCM10027037_09460 [Mucilaginibacter koreensis]
MDILYQADEKYLQAVEELTYGELPKALHLFNNLIDTEPDHARAHYQLGSLYHYQFKNYQTAGYHYKTCITVEPQFPDVYVHYLNLLITLKMYKSIYPTANNALRTPGVCESDIYIVLGNYEEIQHNWKEAQQHYLKAGSSTAESSQYNIAQDHLKRLASKQDGLRRMKYTYQV